VEVTARDVDRIPRGNLMMPQCDFVAVWAEAERLSDKLESRGNQKLVRHGGRNYVPAVGYRDRPVDSGWHAPGLHTPVSGRSAAALEELIEQEVLRSACTRA
jgi:hypothetical protein